MTTSKPHRALIVILLGVITVLTTGCPHGDWTVTVTSRIHEPNQPFTITAWHSNGGNQTLAEYDLPDHQLPDDFFMLGESWGILTNHSRILQLNQGCESKTALPTQDVLSVEVSNAGDQLAVLADAKDADNDQVRLLILNGSCLSKVAEYQFDLPNDADRYYLKCTLSWSTDDSLIALSIPSGLIVDVATGAVVWDTRQRPFLSQRAYQIRFASPSALIWYQGKTHRLATYHRSERDGTLILGPERRLNHNRIMSTHAPTGYYAVFSPPPVALMWGYGILDLYHVDRGFVARHAERFHYMDEIKITPEE